MFRFFKVSCILFTSTFVFLFLQSTFSTAGNHGEIISVTTLDNYEGKGEIPENWKVIEHKGRYNINVEADKDIGYVFHLKSSGIANTGIGKWFDLNIREFHYLRWKWKVIEIPDGYPVTSISKWKPWNHDQAAQVYVIFSSEENPEEILFEDLLKNSNKLGYIWASHSAKKNSIVKQPWQSTWYVIARSGSKDISKWCEEEHDVYKDYKRTFGEGPPKVIGVAIMIDTDGTKDKDGIKNGTAESFIGDIYFSKN